MFFTELDCDRLIKRRMWQLAKRKPDPDVVLAELQKAEQTIARYKSLCVAPTDEEAA